MCCCGGERSAGTSRRHPEPCPRDRSPAPETAGAQPSGCGCGGGLPPVVSCVPLTGRTAARGSDTSGGVARGTLSQSAAADADQVSAAGRFAPAALLDNRTEDENASAGDRLLESSRRSNHTAGPRSTHDRGPTCSCRLIGFASSEPTCDGAPIPASCRRKGDIPRIVARALRSCRRSIAVQPHDIAGLISTESLILAQDERWRRASSMQVERTRDFGLNGEVANG